MHMLNTAKFGQNNNESIMDRFKTEITENIGRSETLIRGDESQMNVSDLDVSKEDFIIVNGVHKIPSEKGATYECPICDRLRAICPYKSYKTYDYCQKCVRKEGQNAFIEGQRIRGESEQQRRVDEQRRRIVEQRRRAEQQRRTRPKIFESVGHQVSKDLNSTFNQTKGYSTNNQSMGMNKHLQQVNKVRFVQSNNVFPLKMPISKYSSTNNLSSSEEHRKRTTSHYEFKQSTPIKNHQVINQNPYQPSSPVLNVEEIIYYPVIHNRLVYQSADNKEALSHRDTHQITRSRYQSHHGGQKHKKGIEKVVTDFLQTTKPDEVLTPSQFKQLADSIYRETNPHLEEHQDR